jgi:outer membrane lipopolysaccharide assembly protein LptE/RlpB
MKHLLPLVATLLVTGCAGYHLGSTQELPYQSVAVPMFKNMTLLPQLEAQVSNAIIKRFQSDGTLKVRSVADADVVLSGVIQKYKRRSVRTLQNNTGSPREYKLTITVRLEARNRAGQFVFEPVTVEGSAETFIGDDLQTSEAQALPLIADDLAKRVVTLLTERW